MKYFKLLMLSLSIFLLGCGEEGNKEDYNNLDDHGRVGEKIQDERFLDSEYAVVQFSADWCSWCRKQYPNLIEVSKDKNFQQVDFFLFDVDGNKTTQMKYDVRLLPTTIYFYKGEEVCRENGYQSVDDLNEEIYIITTL